MKKIVAICVMLISICVNAVACSCKERKVESISLAEAFPTGYAQNEAVDYAKIKVTIKYNDGSTEVVENDKVSITTIDTSTIGNKNIKVSFGGKTLDIPVLVSNNLDEVYQISKVEAPTWLVTNKDNFLDQAEKDYIVGDDNVFKFLLKVSVVDNTGVEKVIDKYKSVSEVHLFNESTNAYYKLNSSNLETYVTIDELNSTYDFTQNAVGEKFKLIIRPEYLKQEQLQDSSMYQTFEFRVEDGWNVYDAKELSVLDNSENNVEAWRSIKSTLENKGIYSIDNQNYSETLGVMIHGNINITVDDIPSDYIYGVEADELALTLDNYQEKSVEGTLKDGTRIYERVLRENQEFGFYGNFFTINVGGDNSIPVASKVGSNGSDATLFNFSGTYVASEQVTTTPTTQGLTTNIRNNTSKYYVENINLVGNTNKAKSLQEGLGGLVMMRTQYSEHHVTNCSSKDFLVGVMSDLADNQFHGENIKIENTYKNAVLVYGGTVFELKNSVIKNAGSSPIVSQHFNSEYDDNNVLLRAPNVVLKDVEIDSFINGTEDINEVDGIDELFAYLREIDVLFNQHGKSVLAEDKFALVNILMSDGEFGEKTTTQGKLTINEEMVANKVNDDNDYGLILESYNIVLNALKLAGMDDEYPLFISKNGYSSMYIEIGTTKLLVDPMVAHYNISQSPSDVVSAIVSASVSDSHGLFAEANEHITMYYKGAAITMKYNNLG